MASADRGACSRGACSRGACSRGACSRGPAMTARQDDAVGLAAADAASALDLLLSDAALGVVRRFLPTSSTLRFAMGLARRPTAAARRGASLAGELASI